MTPVWTVIQESWEEFLNSRIQIQEQNAGGPLWPKLFALASEYQDQAPYDTVLYAEIFAKASEILEQHYLSR